MFNPNAAVLICTAFAVSYHRVFYVVVLLAVVRFCGIASWTLHVSLCMVTNSRRVCVLKCVFSHIQLLFNVYMPCESSGDDDDNFSMQLSVLNDIMHGAKSGLLCCMWRSEFCSNAMLQPAVRHVHVCSDVDYTYNFNMERFSTDRSLLTL